MTLDSQDCKLGFLQFEEVLFCQHWYTLRLLGSIQVPVDLRPFRAVVLCLEWGCALGSFVWVRGLVQLAVGGSVLVAFTGPFTHIIT